MKVRPVYQLSDEAIAKLAVDISLRLTLEGLPTTPGNDYERHLFARRLQLMGKTREETKEALEALGLDDISPGKRESYLNDVLDSVLVGYSNSQPIYEEARC